MRKKEWIIGEDIKANIERCTRVRFRLLLPHFAYLLILFLLMNLSISNAVEVPLSVRNPESVEKEMEPVISGVPFSQGILYDTLSIKLMQGSNDIPVQCSPAAYWPDGSIRWLHIRFVITLQPDETVYLKLLTGVTPEPLTGITHETEGNSIIINTGTSRYAFHKNELKINGSFFEVASGGNTYRAVPDISKWVFEETGPLRTILKTEGNWYNGNTLLENNLVKFTVRIFFYKNKDEIKLQLVFKNNNAFGWDAARSGNAVELSSVRFITDLLSANGNYVFGQGTEKTWNIRLDETNQPVIIESRYNSDGSIAEGYHYQEPLALAQYSYYISTKAWGLISEIKSGFDESMQQDYDRFEKIQRAKVNRNSLENPPGLTGITVWDHLYQDFNSWCDYGDLSWGGEAGRLSGNHYDWPYGMFLQFFRSGYLPFLDAARLFAAHEIDFDVYHTGVDGNAFNYQKNWESRPSHESSDNSFGGGRPSHTWSQGYALMWLLTGDLRARDAFYEIQEGVREYIYESFNDNGYINTSEIRFNGWLTENLVNFWRINPDAKLETPYGQKTIPGAIKDVLQNVFDRENEAGKAGFIIWGDESSGNLRSPLQNLYFLEPAIKACSEVFRTSDAAYADELMLLIERMTSWIMDITYGGTTNSSGYYLPMQIPFWVNTELAKQTEGQIPYLLMACNAAGFCYTETGNEEYITYARKAFSDYVRYLGVAAGDSYIEDLSQRTAASYNSNIYVDSESKIHGWSGRYGQYYLAAENTPTGVYQGKENREIEFELYQNYPNPFNPGTVISYQIPVGTRRGVFLQLCVYDVLGRKIATLVNREQMPGNYNVEFNAGSLSSGVYFAVLKAGSYSKSIKLVLMK